MGIPGSLFFRPGATDPFRVIRYGTELETPLGVAAGPHNQLAFNIVAAWLCGARYIELKTIQTLDELEVSKPCIDMQDEGYNCEWSQELKIEESFREYLNAWILIHILRRELHFEGPTGTLFNMSVGYNLEGILNENVQWFFEKMKDCGSELREAKDSIRTIYPDIDSVNISSCISDNVTLSTMHGCPPDEIGKIGLYLIREKNLHTTIKLNPTLLGPIELRSLLNGQLGFATQVPDLAFEHDLKYPDALLLIHSLQQASEEKGLQFSIKLTNTLETLNRKHVFSEKENMMYMSGRALHPISIRLARKLQLDLGGKTDISFSAGVDCFNITDVISCGFKPVTVCSDLLKPGGYGRLWQYLDHLRRDFAEKSAESIDEFIVNNSTEPGKSPTEAALENLNLYAGRVALIPAYHKQSFTEPSIKTDRELNYFDCIHAPCVDTCPTHQDIPLYLDQTAEGKEVAAFRTVFATNPFPSITGMVCDHLCQLKCTRINYDESLHIREIKRYLSERNGAFSPAVLPVSNGKKAAVIGAGPAGLSCAWFLAETGFEVNVFEQKSSTGGMVSAAIPAFRLTNEATGRDLERILGHGVKLHPNYTVDAINFREIRNLHDVVFVSAGAQTATKPELEGSDAAGVLDPLKFLFDVKRGNPPDIGTNVVIIGGGNTAMDAARTAYRLVGKNGKVTVVYRRSIAEMPADKGEIQAVLQEGIEIIELSGPELIHTENGKVKSLRCSRNILALKGRDGRPAPIKVPGSEFEIPCDTVIPAIGQQADLQFVEGGLQPVKAGMYKTNLQNVYLGGDALRGASTAINAIADGRLAAAEMIADLGMQQAAATFEKGEKPNLQQLLHRKSVRESGVTPVETSLQERQNFRLVLGSYTEEEARKEASRCLRCDEICNVCVSVCPNLANFSYTINPVNWKLQKAVLQDDGSIAFEEDQVFSVNQSYQVLNIRDFCNECGNCTSFCPGKGKPYKDKPGLCLSIQTLKTEDEGFFLSRIGERKVLIFKHKESIKTLSLENGQFVYETEQVVAVINPSGFSLLEVRFLTPCVRECQFTFAAEMSVVMQGALQLGI